MRTNEDKIKAQRRTNSIIEIVFIISLQNDQIKISLQEHKNIVKEVNISLYNMYFSFYQR